MKFYTGLVGLCAQASAQMKNKCDSIYVCVLEISTGTKKCYIITGLMIRVYKLDFFPSARCDEMCFVLEL